MGSEMCIRDRLDVVFRCSNLPTFSVGACDPGLSDHFLLTWSLSFFRPSQCCKTATFRPWNRLSVDRLQLALSESTLCQPSSWNDQSASDLALTYDSTISDTLDRLIPMRTARIRKRPSDPWYDRECHQAKRKLRKLERLLRRLRARDSDSWSLSDVRASLSLCSRSYRRLLRRKRETFWRSKVSNLSLIHI